jgi:hypothetical protein
LTHRREVTGWWVFCFWGGVGDADCERCDWICTSKILFRGAVAKWQGTGLQNLYRRFDSASRLQNFRLNVG